MLRSLALLGCLILTGCSIFPEMSREPTFHNPFPQLSKVAIAPFFNLSNEPTVDGRRVAMAYFNELQTIPGFEVVPVGVVEMAMKENNLSLNSPTEAKRLAQILDVDALVVGAVTDYSPYYPPRMGLQVEWYSANPGFHAIPPGYGLPWGTAEEDKIPAPLIFEAEMALAKAQLATQTPPVEKQAKEASGDQPATGANNSAPDRLARNADDAPAGFPPDWPDPRGFIPPPPKIRPPTCWPNDGPVIRHTRTYNGHDADFTEALSTYYYFRNDARFGGWQSYLQRSEDFIRFCCHIHIAETLTARGGAGETRVVWRQPIIR
jgi:hypothetical protein